MIFGCVAYEHAPEEMRRKLYDIIHKCIFVGYSEEYKAYRNYNPITKKYVINRDGNIHKSVEEDVVTPQAEDEEDEKGIHGGQLNPHTPAVRTPIIMPRIHEHGEPSSTGG